MTEKKSAPKKTKAAVDAGDSASTACGTGNGAVCGAGGGAVYGLGLIGAAVYYIQESSGFGGFLVACLKALVWPVFVVYDLLKHMS